MLFEKIAKKHKKLAETNALFSPQKSPRKIPKNSNKNTFKIRVSGPLHFGFCRTSACKNCPESAKKRGRENRFRKYSPQILNFSVIFAGLE